MADNTHIEWTDATWNPITGCSVVSAGCKHCYAMKLAGTRLKHDPSRAGLTRETSAGPVWTGEVRFNEKWLDQPLRWTRPRRIFVCAHGDLFHEGVQDEWIDRVFAIMASSPQHTFQVLTKRPDRMLEYLTDVVATEHRWESAYTRIRDLQFRRGIGSRPGEVNVDNDVSQGRWPLPNVWLGVSVEDQAAVDARIPLLLKTPAAVRWISAEPLLGPVDLMATDYLTAKLGAYPFKGIASEHRTKLAHMLDWVVAGGESGAGARPMHSAWVRSLRDQCAAAGVAFLFKQWGAWRPIDQGGRDWYESLYRSRRMARAGESQAALDDVYGRECTVDTAVIQRDGVIRPPTEPLAWEQGTDPFLTFRVGKKAAGRLLDDVQYDGYPEASRG